MIRLRELELEEAQANRNEKLRGILVKIWIPASIIVAVLGIGIMFFGGDMGPIYGFDFLAFVGGPIIGGGAVLIFKILPEKEADKTLLRNGGVKLPKDIFPYSEQNYEAINSALRSAGFRNVTCVNMMVSLIVGKGLKKDETKTTLDAETTAVPQITEYLIEKGTQYAFMSDEWNVYISTAISDSIIKIEHWDKTLQTSKSVSYSEDIGSFKINDAENGFSWIDDEHTAFTFIFSDKNNSHVKKAASRVFTININDSDKNKGSDYDKKIACYSYTNDDWHMYRAIPLTESLIKIECWSRGMSIGEFLFGWDWCVIDLNNTDTDFAWTDDEHTSFTITTKDPDNGSYWEQDTFVVFELEKSDVKYKTVYEYLHGDSQSTAKTEKDGFSADANTSVTVGNYVFSVPKYWDADITESDNYRAYAETTGRTAVLQIRSRKDNSDTVTFDLLKEETENGKMAKSFETWFDSCGDVSSQFYENGRIQGYLYSCDFTHEGIDGKCKCLVFPSEDNNCWIFVSLMETVNTEFTYFEDFEKTLASVSVTEFEEDQPAILYEADEEGATYNSPNAPIIDDVSESQPIDEQKTDENLTVDNCPELADILSMKAEIDPAYITFASKYKGRIIEFDGRIDYCVNHENYKTRFDYLVSAGDYDPDHQIGPTFKFEDVGYTDLHTDCDSVSIGLNVHIVAEVEGINSDTGLFFLKPVSITSR